MNELRVAVERAVRPLRASEARKDRMREELYAHLWSIFEEEQAGGATEAEAARRACDRFGEPRELTPGLQAAVPRVEAALFTQAPGVHRVEGLFRRRFERRKGESVAMWAARVAIFFFLLSAVIVFVFNPLLIRLVSRQPNYAKALTCGSVVAVLTAGNAFILFLLSGGIFYKGWSASPGKAVARTALHGAIMSLAVISSGAAFGVAMRERIPFERIHLHLLIGLALLAPFLMAFLSVAISAERRRFHEWGCLDLEEARGGAPPPGAQVS